VNRSSVARAVAALALSAGLALPAFAAGQKPETEEQKVLYAIGSAMTRSTERLELTEAEVQELLRGLADGLAGKGRVEKPEEFGPLFESFVATRMEEVGKREKALADEFLAQSAGEKGATKAENGMVFLEQASGAGEPPKVDDIIEVHYVGSLRDGKVFDSSRDRGAPETIQLANTIECWKQALPKMKPGGRALVTCPSEIAFGERGTDNVKPGAALRFDIELIKVVR
jgi:FKBP-type peptidyl-prolyl cis-trans isomerase